jgi:hypothetical protein
MGSNPAPTTLTDGSRLPTPQCASATERRVAALGKPALHGRGYRASSAAVSSWQLRKHLARRAAGLVLVALGAQLIIGISMVLWGFPLWLATAHSAGAACLLVATVALNRALWPTV